MKDFVISHIKDNDGVTPVILMYLMGREFDYKLLEVYEVEDYVDEFLEQDLSIYENIYILDLTLSEKNYKKIEKSLYKDKFKVFDHHLTHLFAYNKPYVTIDIKECASSLFYHCLKKVYSFGTPCVDNYIQLVKSLDLYTFEEDGNKEASYLSDLLTLYGVDTYISKMVNRLKEDVFCFNDFEKEWFFLDKKNRDEYLEKKSDKVFFIKIENYIGGVVFAEKYRNELAHFLLSKNSNLDFAACINPQGGVSLRSNGKLDLSAFAKKYDEKGGGHKNAAGFSFPKSLQEKIIKELFFDCDILDEGN